jgi:hypothetical protein
VQSGSCWSNCKTPPMLTCADKGMVHQSECLGGACHGHIDAQGCCASCIDCGFGTGHIACEPGSECYRWDAQGCCTGCCGPCPEGQPCRWYACPDPTTPVITCPPTILPRDFPTCHECIEECEGNCVRTRMPPGVRIGAGGNCELIPVDGPINSCEDAGYSTLCGMGFGCSACKEVRFDNGGSWVCCTWCEQMPTGIAGLECAQR